MAKTLRHSRLVAKFAKSFWDETAKEYRYHVKENGRFVAGSFRLKQISSNEGVYAVVGQPIGKPSLALQGYRFPKASYNLAEAKAWVKATLSSVTVDCESLFKNALPMSYADADDFMYRTQRFEMKDDPEDDEDGEEGEEGDDHEVKCEGTTEEAREHGVLHDHEFELKVEVDEDGVVHFVGKTGGPSKGDDHTHEIAAVTSESKETSFRIDTTESSSGDSHYHLLEVELDEPLGPQDAAEDEEDEEEDTETSASKDDCRCEGRAPAFHVKSRLSKAAIEGVALHRDGVGALTRQGYLSKLYGDGAGVICYGDGSDGRCFLGSDMAFCSGLDLEKSASKDGKRLLHEVTRTGVFVHPWRGVFEMDLKKLEMMKKHHLMGVLGQVPPLNISHDNSRGAAGWMENLLLREMTKRAKDETGEDYDHEGVSMFSDSALTPWGRREILEDKKYRYTSIEMAFKFSDVERFRKYKPSRDPDKRKKEDDELVTKGEIIYENVLLGAAVTNIPFIPRLKAFAASRSTVTAYQEALQRFGDISTAKAAVDADLRAMGLIA